MLPTWQRKGKQSSSISLGKEEGICFYYSTLALILKDIFIVRGNIFLFSLLLRLVRDAELVFCYLSTSVCLSVSDAFLDVVKDLVVQQLFQDLTNCISLCCSVFPYAILFHIILTWESPKWDVGGISLENPRSAPKKDPAAKPWWADSSPLTNDAPKG